MVKSHKVTFAAVAAMAVALSLAVLPALTNQVFAQFPDSQGQGHTQTCEKVKTGRRGKETAQASHRNLPIMIKLHTLEK